MNRSVFIGRKNLTDEIRLDVFEDQIRQFISETNHTESLEHHLKAELVPETIRKEFNLPDDMSNLEVDYNQVRLYDSTVAIKLQIWSGQEVLTTSLNQE